MATFNTDDDSKCNLYHKTDKGNSSLIHFQNPYGGIPQNLLTNLIGVAILLGLFLILRKSAWKVINHIVPKNDIDRWTHIFFSFSNAMSHVNDLRKSHMDQEDHMDQGFQVEHPGESRSGEITEGGDNGTVSTKVRHF